MKALGGKALIAEDLTAVKPNKSLTLCENNPQIGHNRDFSVKNRRAVPLIFWRRTTESGFEQGRCRFQITLFRLDLSLDTLGFRLQR